MSFWDSILSDVTSLGQDIFGNSTSSASSADSLTGSSTGDNFLAKVGKTALSSVGDIQKKQSQNLDKDFSIYKMLERNMSLQSTTGAFMGEFRPKPAPSYGSPNYFGNADDTEAHWGQLLQSFVGNTGVKAGTSTRTLF